MLIYFRSIGLRSVMMLAASTLLAALVVAQNQPPGSNGQSSSVSPYLQLKAEVDLPQAPDDKSAPTVAVGLGQISPTDFSGSQVGLFGELADLEGVYKFTCRKNSSQQVEEWSVYINRSADAKSGNASTIGSGRLLSEPLARIYSKSGQLLLEWNTKNITRYNGQLSNAVLDLSSGGHSHSVNLRTCISKDSIPLDLEKDVTRVPLEMTNLPRKEFLTLVVNDVEFQGYNSNGPGFTLEPVSGRGKLREVVRIKRADAVATEINFAIIDRESGPELNIRTAYRPTGAQKTPFVAEEISSSREKMQRSLEEATTRMANAKAAMPNLASRLQSAKSRRTNSVREENERVAEISNAQAGLRRAQSAVRRFERSLPKLKASLEAMTSVVEVGKMLHKNVRFHISVLADDGSRSLELVRFGETKLAQGSALVTIP